MNFATMTKKMLLSAAFALVFFASTVTPAFAQWAYDDYGGSNWAYDDYGSFGSSNWGYDDYSYGSNYSNWAYDDYGYSNYSNWAYDDYGYSDYSNWAYDDYGYSNYSNWAYDDYGYSDYATPYYGCSGSSCGGYSDYGYSDYATPYYGCSGSSCGGNSYSTPSRSSGGGLGLNLNYSDNDTTVTNNIDNSVRIRSNVDNSVRINNSSTTTNNYCSNGDGNCNTNYYARSNDDDDDDDDNDNDDFRVLCRVSDSSIDEGDTVTFTADIDGGDSPYDIEWDGDISGDDRTERVRFNRSGTYEIELTVRDDDGNRDSDECTVRVGDEDDDDDDNDNVNVITRTNLGTPTGNLASLDSVFLSQVPYTGPQDVLKVLGVLAFVAIWSTGVAMYFKRRRQQKAVSTRLADFKTANKTANSIR
ncbi:MAG: hypothetical protein RL150_29 [Candidatus Parcubacteria bacterium]|jgi:hypothetical protein